MLNVTWVLASGVTQTVSLAETASAANQTAVIQSALDQVAAAGGGTVSLSAGAWTVSGTGKAADGCLRVGSNTILEGAGQGQTVLSLADGSSAVTGIIRTDSGRTLSDGTVTTVNAVTLRNLTIDGNSAGTTGDVDGFYCGPKPGTSQADTNITIDSVEIRNCSRYGFDPHEQTIGLTITNSSAHHNGLDGIIVDFCTDVTLANNTVFANGRHGINIVSGSSDVQIIDNIVTDNGVSGIVIQTGDNEIRAWTSDVTVSGGVVSGNGSFGIDAHHARDVAISGVALLNNGSFGITLAGTDGATLTGNTFAGNGGTTLVRRITYVQDFDDADTANDRAIVTSGVTIDGIAVADTVLALDQVAWSWTVTAQSDMITGSTGRDVIAADAGNDAVMGGAGNDLLYGNDGDDHLDGGAGSDELQGGLGADTLAYSGGVDVINGGAGDDTVDFQSLNSSITVRLVSNGFDAFVGGVGVATVLAVENVHGTAFNDQIVGDSSANRLYGGAGADSLDGGAGADHLDGGADNDRVTGGSGKDVFYAHAGQGIDIVADFTNGADKLALRGVNSAAELIIAVTADGARVTDSSGTYGFVLRGVSTAVLDPSDFVFFG